MSDLLKRLRAIAAHEHDDHSVAADAEIAIRERDAYISRLREVLADAEDSQHVILAERDAFSSAMMAEERRRKTAETEVAALKSERDALSEALDRLDRATKVFAVYFCREQRRQSPPGHRPEECSLYLVYQEAVDRARAALSRLEVFDG